MAAIFGVTFSRTQLQFPADRTTSESFFVFAPQLVKQTYIACAVVSGIVVPGVI